MLVLEILKKGGPATMLIVLAGLFAAWIIAERLLHLRRAQVNAPEFLRGIVNVLKKQNHTEAISLCDKSPGPIAHLVRAAIFHRDKGPEEMRRAIDEAGLAEVPRLERNLKLLLALVHIAPMLGLLGTVLGIIDLFSVMEAKGSFIDIKSMAESLWPAMISTAAGLSVAIVAYGFYAYFVERVEQITLDMEKVASEIMYFLQNPPTRDP